MMDNKTHPFILHIGMPKTGTTTLQRSVFANHPELLFFGKAPKNCRGSIQHDLMAELVWRRFVKPDFNRAAELYAQLTRRAAEENRRLLYSQESLMLNRHRVQRFRAQNLKKIVGDAQILVCLRSPASLVQSVYTQTLKRDNIGSRAHVGKAHRFESFDKWIQKGFWQGRAPKTHLEYPKTLQIFADVFGTDAINIFLFEQLVEDQTRFIRDLCERIGIDADKGVELAEGKRLNPRWTQEQLDQLERLNKDPKRAMRFRGSNKQKRKEMLRVGQSNDSPKAVVDISPAWKKRIEDKTRSGNRMIEKQWGVPLEQYGYPV